MKKCMYGSILTPDASNDRRVYLVASEKIDNLLCVQPNVKEGKPATFRTGLPFTRYLVLWLDGDSPRGPNN